MQFDLAGRVLSTSLSPTVLTGRREPCVFCPTPVSRKGEHGWPKWFLERWEGQGPFTRERNGEPIPRRDGTPQRTPEMAPVKVPVCGSGSPNDCNAWLNTTFEQPARDAVRAVVDHGDVLRAPETTHFARWWVKTLLLLHHARAQDSFPGPGISRWELPDDMLPTMRQTGELPSDLSLWMAVVDRGSAGGHLDDLLRIFLPFTSADGGQPAEGRSGVVGVTLGDGRSASFQLVYHSRCNFDHPFERAGLATRLWPSPPHELDISTHPAIDAVGYVQFCRLFVSGGVDCHLRRGERLHLHAYQDGKFSLLPCFDPDCGVGSAESTPT